LGLPFSVDESIRCDGTVRIGDRLRWWDKNDEDSMALSMLVQQSDLA
jgi:hypothetical protein